MRYLTSISLALILLMALACSSEPTEPPPPAFSDAEVIGAVKGHLRSFTMHSYCTEIANNTERWKVVQDKSNPDKYLVTSHYGEDATWTLVGSLLRVIPTSKDSTWASSYGC